MQLKTIKPKESSVKYNPKADELILVSELKFIYNWKIGEFQLDQNPFGEAKPVKISNVKSENDYKKLIFEANFRKELTEFTLISNFHYDHVLYETLLNCESINSDIDSDKDKIEIIFSNGNISKVYFYKYEEYNLISSLAIVAEDQKLYLIKQNPWSKNLIMNIEVNQDTLYCKLENEIYSYKLEVQPFIIELIRKLISNN